MRLSFRKSVSGKEIEYEAVKNLLMGIFCIPVSIFFLIFLIIDNTHRLMWGILLVMGIGLMILCFYQYSKLSK